jgi:hypothetical protein
VPGITRLVGPGNVSASVRISNRIVDIIVGQVEVEGILLWLRPVAWEVVVRRGPLLSVTLRCARIGDAVTAALDRARTGNRVPRDYALIDAGPMICPLAVLGRTDLTSIGQLRAEDFPNPESRRDNPRVEGVTQLRRWREGITLVH